MTRMATHTIQDAPEASRPPLGSLVQFSPTGRLLTPMDLPAGPE